MPRKSKAKKDNSAVAIADTLDVVIEKAGLVPASKLPARLDPPEPQLLPLPRSDLPPPDDRELIQPGPNTARPRPSHDRNGEEYEPKGFAERLRPTGPRKREPGEAGVVYTGPNVLVKMDADTISFDLKRPLTNESRDGVEMYLTAKQQDKLTAAGFDDLSPNGDASAWLAPRNQQSLAVVQQLATEFDQKGERIAAGHDR